MPSGCGRIAADTVRRILADELVAGRPAESHPVTVMNMYKSKGKEFDAVLIVEGQHQAKLLDHDWDAKRITQQRRVLRVAITRARYAVIFIRHRGAMQLAPAAIQPPVPGGIGAVTR
jgi:DNA helicase II / ATP-dependent DNA helicase PcrA